MEDRAASQSPTPSARSRLCLRSLRHGYRIGGWRPSVAILSGCVRSTIQANCRIGPRSLAKCTAGSTPARLGGASPLLGGATHDAMVSQRTASSHRRDCSLLGSHSTENSRPSRPGMTRGCSHTVRAAWLQPGLPSCRLHLGSRRPEPACGRPVDSIVKHA
jgi:hypothetical protein